MEKVENIESISNENARKENRTRHSGLLKWIGIFSVVLFAAAAAAPQPKLDWEGYVLPMVNGFRNRNWHAGGRIIDQPLKGLNIVISGATSGLGLGLTKAMTKLGAHVIAIGRNPQKLQKLQSDKAIVSNGSISTVVADYMDLASVAKAGDEIASSFDKVDILINNAGMHEGPNYPTMPQRPQSRQGYDAVFTVNYLSHFLLTEKLLPTMKQSNIRHPVIMQMSSSFHYGGNGEDLVPNNNRPPIASLPGGAIAYYVYRTVRGYANSKLAQILHAEVLRNKHAPKGFRIVSVCPSWVTSNILSSLSWFSMIYEQFMYKNDEYGLSSSIHAMFSEDEGNFFVNLRLMKVGNILGFPYTFLFGIQDTLIVMVAITAMFVQKLFPELTSVKSSHVSYDETVQNQLYDWSKQAVMEWL